MVKFAVLGCGRIGRMHALNLARHPRAELAYVYDIAGDAAAATAEATGARRAGAVDEILGAAEVEAVLIASSTDTHLDLLVRAVEAGKAVLCEKPIDLDLAKVDASWERIKDRKPTVMVGFNRRFDPSFKALRDRIQAGEIGKLEQVVITSRDPGPPPVAYIKVSGGLFRDMTIHDFDMARYLMGDIAAVHAIGANLVDPAIEAGRRHRRRDGDAGREERRALPDQQQPALRLRLRPAGRGVRREGHAPGRQPAPDHALVLGRRRDRGQAIPSSTSSSSATRRPISPRSTTSSTASSRVRRRLPATATAARRCASPTPRSRACATGRTVRLD